MELLNTALDLAAMIPNSFALVGFAVGIVGASISIGHYREGDPAVALVTTDADHWGEEEDAYAGERFYADAA